MTTTRTRVANITPGIMGWEVRGYVGGVLVAARWTAGNYQDARAEELRMRVEWAASQRGAVRS